MMSCILIGVCLLLVWASSEVADGLLGLSWQLVSLQSTISIGCTPSRRNTSAPTVCSDSNHEVALPMIEVPDWEDARRRRPVVVHAKSQYRYWHNGLPAGNARRVTPTCEQESSTFGVRSSLKEEGRVLLSS